MGSGWHWYITIFTVVNIVACVWLIVWGSRQGDPSKAEDDTLDKSWDGVNERNQPLPRWWLWLFLGTIVWGLGYLVYYPGLGAFAGTGGWTQIQQYEQERERIDAIYNEKFSQLAALDVTQLSENAEAMDIAGRLFGSNCATCHGSDARGALGFPNLTDTDWQWGGSPDAIHQTLVGGRQAAMPPWAPALGEQGTREVVAYVKAISGLAPTSAESEAGQARYNMFCIACHGPDGTGNQALGAPNLTDDIWLYGSSDEALTNALVAGLNGLMPAQRDLLSEAEIKLLTAYVVSLGGTDSAGE